MRRNTVEGLNDVGNGSAVDVLDPRTDEGGAYLLPPVCVPLVFSASKREEIDITDRDGDGGEGIASASILKQRKRP